jgi:hypothetical protein
MTDEAVQMEILAELRKANAFLGEISGVQPIRWYCVPEVDANGEIVCPGGERLFRHDPQYERDPDRLYHKLDEGQWRSVEFGGSTTLKKSHNLWKSQAVMTPEEGRAAEPRAVENEIPETKPAPKAKAASKAKATPAAKREPAVRAAPEPTRTSTPREPEGVPATKEWLEAWERDLSPRVLRVMNERFGYARELQKHESGSEAREEARRTVRLAFWEYFREVPLLAPCQLDESGLMDFTPATIALADIPTACDELDRYLAGEDIRQAPIGVL